MYVYIYIYTLYYHMIYIHYIYIYLWQPAGSKLLDSVELLVFQQANPETQLFRWATTFRNFRVFSGLALQPFGSSTGISRHHWLDFPKCALQHLWKQCCVLSICHIFPCSIPSILRNVCSWEHMVAYENLSTTLGKYENRTAVNSQRKTVNSQRKTVFFFGSFQAN